MDIERDAVVCSDEVNALRDSVGWERSAVSYGDILAAHYTHYTVRNRDGMLVAYMSVLSDGIADALLLDLMVHPHHQRHGLGAQVVRRALADMKTAGIQCVQVAFADHLEPFYAECGFQIIKAGVVDFKHMM